MERYPPLLPPPARHYLSVDTHKVRRRASVRLCSPISPPGGFGLRAQDITGVHHRRAARNTPRGLYREIDPESPNPESYLLCDAGSDTVYTRQKMRLNFNYIIYSTYYICIIEAFMGKTPDDRGIYLDFQKPVVKIISLKVFYKM
jgi:hypothetical protein